MPIPPAVLSGLCPSDSFIVSYPRSGNTWLRHLLKEVVVRRHPELSAQESIEDLLPTVHKERPVVPAIASLGLQTRIFKSHNIIDLRGRRMVYAFRQAPDALVSYYHLCKRKADMEGISKDSRDMLQFCREEVDDWCEHVRLALEQHATHPDQILFIAFEQMSEDTPTALRRVVDFLGLDANLEIIHGSVEACAFESLKARREKEKPVLAQRDFFRKGKVGGGAEELDPEVLALIQRKTSELYARCLAAATAS